jgi:hypothetical protein
LTVATSKLALISCVALLMNAALFLSCGGSSAHNNSSPQPIEMSGSNVQPIVVNAGPANNYANGVFTSVTVCVPSSSNCQTIDGILVDTGSYGLRLLSSSGGGALTLSLPAQNGPSGGPLGECAPFVSGYTWGAIKSADVSISGEHASSVPVQVIDPTFSSIPSKCKDTGVPADNSLSALGANGVLGIGPFAEDCGSGCAQTSSANSGWYFECASASCQVAAVEPTKQVQNPVTLFGSDNNGVILELPAVTGSETSVSGSMVFGIGTQSNNGLGSAKVFPINPNGEFNTIYKGQSYPAFVDSGSNAYFFLDSKTTGLPVCSNNSGFYCPASPTTISATPSSGSASSTIIFSVTSANTLFSNSSDFVFPPLAGPNAGTFDWGLPFFYGRNVFTAIDARTTPAGTGPFWAF